MRAYIGRAGVRCNVFLYTNYLLLKQRPGPNSLSNNKAAIGQTRSMIQSAGLPTDQPLFYSLTVSGLYSFIFAMESYIAMTYAVALVALNCLLQVFIAPVERGFFYFVIFTAFAVLNAIHIFHIFYATARPLECTIMVGRQDECLDNCKQAS